MTIRSGSALFLLITGWLAAFAPAQAADCGATEGNTRLDVTFTGLHNAKGQITIVIYGDRPEDFLVKGKRLVKQRIPAQTGSVSVCLALPAPGHYALAAYHDEDGDGKLNRSFIGVPTEGYGFSNDAPAVMGLPAFSDVLFNAGPGDTAIKVAIRYP